MRSRTLPERALITAAGALLLGSCAAPPGSMTKPNLNDPTNPQAAEAPLDPPSQTLISTDAAQMNGPAGATHNQMGHPEPAAHSMHNMQGMRMEMNTGPASSKMPGPGPAAKHVYTCVMHPEVVVDEPGKCPTCGMNLVFKKGASAPDHGDHGHHEHGGDE